MKVLVVGNGGREHALAWKLLQAETVQQVLCVPGNGGTATLPGCRNLALNVTDFEGMARIALVNGVSLVVVGPEVPLAAGITDYLQKHNPQLKVFGPTQAAAQIEASKAWAKAFMAEAGIPTAAYAQFSEEAAALDYVAAQGVPIVVKADGLAAGKGVTVAHTLAEAQQAIAEAFGGKFGAAGQTVVIEAYLTGQEASVLAVTDGQTIRPLLPAQDHKPIGEGDTGPNTGGMGAYAPTPVVSEALLTRIQTEILDPAIATFQARGIRYCGVLYAGLMITPTGDPKVIEFNCRFGDPETQAVLPLLETPLHELMLACVAGRLAELPPIAWQSGAAACVVVAAEGYPGSYAKGHPITGLEAAAAQGAIVFHAGTELKQGRIQTNGGRVLGVTATGADFDGAIAQAYEALHHIQFDGMVYRRDIGYRVRNSSANAS